MTGAAAGAALGVLGDLVEDVVVRLPGTPARGSDTPVTVRRRRGGSAANVAAAAARLVAVRFCGAVGDDPLGAALVADLRADGVDVHAEVLAGAATGTVVVLVDPDGERTMLPDRAAAAGLGRVPRAFLAGLGLLHLPLYSLLEGRTAATAHALLGRPGPAVSLDASSVGALGRYGADRLLSLVRSLAPAVLFANRDEAALLGISAVGPSPAPAGTVVVVKQGPGPAVLLRAGEPSAHVPARPLPGLADSTGAGDAFAAGYLAALLAGADPVAAAHAGHDRAHRLLAPRVP